MKKYHKRNKDNNQKKMETKERNYENKILKEKFAREEVVGEGERGPARETRGKE